MRSPMLGKSFSSQDLILLLAGCGLFILAGLIHNGTKKPEIILTKQDSALNLNADLMVLMSAGNKRLLADLIWVQTLMESDTIHYVGPNKLNWMYLRFRTISVLDPYFYQNYAWGGQYLAIIKDDMLSGNSLMETGLKYYPDDYQLQYMLGFSYYFELSNYDKGIYYFEKIVNQPKAPPGLKSILYKMKVAKGFDLDTALNLIKSQIDQSRDVQIKYKLTRDYYALKAERDLKCLNHGLENCDQVDADGVKYLRRNNRFYSASLFVPYRLGKKGKYIEATPVNTFE